MIQRLREDWRETDKILVLVELGIIVATAFMGFQFMEYNSALENEGCRYYYEEHVPGWEDTGGEFMNSTEYERQQKLGPAADMNYSSGNIQR